MGQTDGATGHGATSQRETGFSSWLERGLGSGDKAGGYSIAERMEQRVEAQVMGRVRDLGGPTRDTDERNERTGPRAGEARPERGAAEAQRAERAAEDRPTERSDERDGQNEHAREGVGGAARPEAPRARSLEGRAHSLQAADSAEANGAESPSPDGLPQNEASFDPAVQSSAPQAPATAASVAQASSGLPASAMPAVGPVASNTLTNALHGVAVDGPRAAAGSKGAPAAEIAPRSAPADDLELAEKVMHQLRARLQLGQREALIELRPSELGRIGVHLRFENGALTATIRAERPETLAVLEAHAPELRAWLAQDGAEVREIDLGLAERGALFDKPQQRQHDRALGRSSGGSTAREARERAPEAVHALSRMVAGDSTPGVDVPSVDMLV